MSKKIFEIKPEDWEKSMSTENEAFVNGLFKTFQNCHPFQKQGNFYPTQIPVELGLGTIATNRSIRFIKPISSTKFLAYADNNKFYEIDASAGTVTDKSASFGASVSTAYGLGLWKSGYVYIDGDGNVRWINSGYSSDASILTGLTAFIHPFCVGADGYGYIGNGNNVAKLVINTGTTGNSTAVAPSLESGSAVRQLVNDGRYLVWIADGVGVNRCLVAFWDLAKSVFDQIYEFPASSIKSADQVGDFIKIITPEGIWKTNIASKPELVVPFGGTVTLFPQTFASTTIDNNILLWAGASNTVYGYGNKFKNKPDRLFQPYTVIGATGIDAISSNNTYIVCSAVVSASVKLYSLNTSSTLSTATFNLSALSLPQPYSFSHVNVTLRNPVSSGNSVSVKVLTAPNTSGVGQKTIKASETKTNSTDPSEMHLTFDHISANDGSDLKSFDTISDLQVTTNVGIRSLQVYGDPLDERTSYV